MNRIVAIVGRPNVGKSTLFNRLTGARTAIVNDISGVTRDRIYGEAEWDGREFTIVDTGGFIPYEQDQFTGAVNHQVKLAIKEADLLLFMVDVRTGITDEDEAFADLLRREHKKVVVVSNKTDSHDYIPEGHQFYKFGFEHVIPVSSLNGSGTNDLLDKIIDILEISSSEDKKPSIREGIPRFAILGRPNAGKSTFVNSLLGEERNIVSDTPGTTRDSIHTYYNKFNREFYLIDTAGLRKRGKVREDLEYYSVVRAIRALEYADVVYVLIDASHGIESQDVNIISLALRRKKGVVVLVNKWDSVEKDAKTHIDYENMIRLKMQPFTDFPVIFISAKEKTRIMKTLEKGLEVFENRKRKITTSKLNEFLQEAVSKFHPPSVKGRFIKIKYITQLPGDIPTFGLFCNFPQYIRDPYKRYLENKLREEYNFNGTPIQLVFKKK